ncbi:hypothetical protein Pla52o_36730 [Novipirellula galeiformis]|uniref:Uncharacterized protein n=1 Tax=Novipirellula galeiformis TaxID=2528004 RepID=A0A5C6CDP5_9BACT|nr:hypothetical protein Pla52o_36730 [Novipirellula galeiformis]
MKESVEGGPRECESIISGEWLVLSGLQVNVAAGCVSVWLTAGKRTLVEGVWIQSSSRFAAANAAWIC